MAMLNNQRVYIYIELQQKQTNRITCHVCIPISFAAKNNRQLAVKPTWLFEVYTDVLSTRYPHNVWSLFRLYPAEMMVYKHAHIRLFHG